MTLVWVKERLGSVGKKYSMKSKASGNTAENILRVLLRLGSGDGSSKYGLPITPKTKLKLGESPRITEITFMVLIYHQSIAFPCLVRLRLLREKDQARRIYNEEKTQTTTPVRRPRLTFYSICVVNDE